VRRPGGRLLAFGDVERGEAVAVRLVKSTFGRRQRA
jgi:hypothetical protein